MKILRLSSYYYPEDIASSYLGQNVREACAEAGIETVIYVPVPSRGISEEQREYYKRHRNEVMLNGMLKVYRFPLMKEGKNPIGRAVRYLIQCLKHYYYGTKSDDAKTANVLFCASTPPIIGITAAAVCKKLKVPFIYNLQDIFPDSLVGTGLAKKDGLLWKIGRKIEDFTYRHADKIIVISEDFKKNIMAKGVPEDKIVVIYNWVDENAVHPVEDEENPLFEEFGISRDRFRVVYAGNLGNAQNIDIIMDAARKLKKNDNIQFVVFGKGGLENDIKAAKENEQLDNLLVLPLQPYERVSSVYSLGDVCIVACKPGLGGAAMPSKTWSIMSCGSAVLANFDEGELKAIVEGNNCGVFTKAGDLDAFVAAIENLSQNPSRCEEMGRNGREFILHNLTKEVGTQKYVDVIKSFEKI